MCVCVCVCAGVTCEYMYVWCDSFFTLHGVCIYIMYMNAVYGTCTLSTLQVHEHVV